MSRMATPITVPDYNAQAEFANRHTPDCWYCNQPIDLLEEAHVMLPGQWMVNRDLGQAVFVLDPDIPLELVQLPNGQMALTMDVTKITKHAHVECHEQVRAELLGMDPELHQHEEWYGPR